MLGLLSRAAFPARAGLNKRIDWVMATPIRNRDGRHVLIALVWRFNVALGGCWPSYETLANDAGIARSTVAEAVNQLERNGWLAIGRKFGQPNIYRPKSEDEIISEEWAFPSRAAISNWRNNPSDSDTT